MEDNARRSRRDLIQNIAIVALSLSAVLLFAQSQIYNLISGQDPLGDQFSGSASVDATLQQTPLTAPVRVAVTGAYTRYGACLTTDAESFSDLGLLLKESLGSAGSLTACRGRDFLTALNSTSVYYDFLSPLPLSILAKLVGGDSAADSVSARHLVLSVGSGTVSLYTWDGEDDFRFCQVPPVSADDMTAIASNCTFGAAAFAMDQEDPTYSRIAPCSLLLEEQPDLPVLSADNPLSSTDQVLTSLGFNPSTKNRYTDSGGTEIIREADRSLQIEPDGTVIYQSSGVSLGISAADDVPTLSEAVDGCTALLRRLLGDQSGEAALYLEAVSQAGETTVLRFGYHADGVPIYFSDGGAAAEVTLAGVSVTELSLRFRQYTDSGETSLLLPLRQALAIAAAGREGAELSIGYADGGASVSAQWLAE